MDRLDGLATFVAVAETGAFVAAARRVGRSPTVVTRTVAALERHLGARLFNRTTRAVALTDAGRRHLDAARRLLADYAALESRAAAERIEPVGSVIVAASVVFGRLHVQPLVTEFLRRHPAVSIRLELADRTAALVDEGIDVAIRLGALGDSSARATRVGTVRRGVYASPAYLAAHGEPRVPGDLVRHRCIAFTGVLPNPARWTFGSGRRRAAVAVAPRLVTNLADPAIDAAVAGFGIVCALSYMVDHLVATGTLRPVLAAHEPPMVPVHVVHPAGRQAATAARAFIDHAVPALRARFGPTTGVASSSAPLHNRAPNRP